MTPSPTPHPSTPQVKCGECGYPEDDLRHVVAAAHSAYHPFVPLQPRDEREGRMTSRKRRGDIEAALGGARQWSEGWAILLNRYESAVRAEERAAVLAKVGELVDAALARHGDNYLPGIVGQALSELAGQIDALAAIESEGQG